MGVLEEYKIYLERTRTSGETMIKYPLYTNCYASALEAMWSNIQYNKEAKAQCPPQGLVSNIIAFMGVRGSGKTTALNEFNNILREYNAYKNRHGNVLLPREQLRKHTGCFHVLRSIDASLLEKDEDIIELIWANMYKDFDIALRKKLNYRDCREASDEVSKSIVDQFDKVYKSYKQSKEKQVMLGDTVLAKLKNLASSLKTKEFCDELIEKFLKYMYPETNEKDNCDYLVVTVDDLDLNLESGYRILENLYRYLNNPRVIVLISADRLQIKMISDKHFIEAFYIKGATNDSLYTVHAVHLSDDFLQKVLPLSNRIYLPDSRIILNKAMIVKADRSSLLKPFILGKIAEKMGIYYDAVGLKWHFCVPKTLRELIQYNDFLETLYDMEGGECDTEEKIRLYEVNHERFNRNISENMAPRILNLDQQRIFELILGRNIERRAEYAVNFLNNRKKDTARGEKQQKLSDFVDDQNYCYSDLLEAIYSFGRENYAEKALIHCVLASFTAEMTKEYFNYKYNPDELARDEAARRLESFLGNTFGGIWFGKVGFGVMADKNINKDTNKEPIMIQWVDQGDIDRFNYRFRFEIKGKKTIPIDNISSIIPTVECVFALFPNYYDENKNKTEPVWKIEIKGGEGNAYTIDVSVANKSADFDIWGFVGKEIAIEGKSMLQRQTDKIVEALLIGYSEYYEKKRGKITEAEKKTWREQLLSKSIWYQSIEHKIHFPFYNLDLAYNVIKRVKRKMMQEEMVDKSEILAYLQKVYGHIAYELQREDQFYEGVKNSIEEMTDGQTRKKIASCFKDDFVSHPFIKAIGYQYWDNKNKEMVSEKENIDKTDFNELLFSILVGFHPDKKMDKYAVAEVE